jgi:hypothetical protein
MRRRTFFASFIVLSIMLAISGCSKPETPAATSGLTDAEIDNIVRQSYRFVAMYNVNNKFALKQGGWNTVVADTVLKDHTMRDIARPNNDTLYIGCMLDLRAEPVVLDFPAFDSDYVSLMITAYDHYVNVPMTTRNGDFANPEKMLVYNARTAGYDGEQVEGIERYFEATGDFVSAVFRVMPHASDPERFAKVVDQMQTVQLMTLSEFRGGEALPVIDPGFPPVGRTDFDIFGDNLLEVMQFVFNHTIFDPDDEVDQAVLAAYAPLGVAPGKTYDPDAVAAIDGAKVRQTAERVWAEETAKVGVPEWDKKHIQAMFQPKGQISQEVLTFQSVLYDIENGFFIPNDREKYSVGANAGMQLDDDGGIAIYVAAEQPPGVPEENWLPITREDLGIGPIMRLYEPDLERFETWEAPKAEKL